MFKRSLITSNRYKSILACYFAAGLLLISLGGCRCNDIPEPEAKNKNKNEVADAGVIQSPEQAVTREAVAQIQSLQDSNVKGKVVFTQVPDGIKIVADIDGLTPGEHGFHVHECGICEGDGTSACAHFNPTNSKHGGPDSVERHVGDLGNIVADESGHGHYERVDKLIALHGDHSIVGRSVIVHADPDDFTSQPAGNAGKRIACGVIEVAPSK